MHIRDVERWSVDIGNVMVGNLTKAEQEHVSSAYIVHGLDYAKKELDRLIRDSVRLIEGSIDGLKMLIDRRGAKNVWIISRATGIERLTDTRILQSKDIFAKTGLLEDHVRYIDQREDMAGVCAELDINGHIGNNGEVLFHLQDVVPCLVWLNCPQEYVNLWLPRLHNAPFILKDWRPLTALLK